MGTRSAVGTLDEAGDFKGRYVHWDGYPSGVGTAVRKIVKRDGVAKALKVITEDHYGWSTLDGKEEQKLSPGYDDGRFEAVPGYGIAYTTFQGQSSPDEWVSGTDLMIEYIHIVSPDGTVVTK